MSVAVNAGPTTKYCSCCQHVNFVRVTAALQRFQAVCVLRNFYFPSILVIDEILVWMETHITRDYTGQLRSLVRRLIV